MIAKMAFIKPKLMITIKAGLFNTWVDSIRTEEINWAIQLGDGLMRGHPLSQRLRISASRDASSAFTDAVFFDGVSNRNRQAANPKINADTDSQITRLANSQPVNGTTQLFL
jgi:hypothetical protein